VRESNASGVVFLSGDVHFGEVAEAGGGCALDYPVMDVTSSGMTHTVMGFLGKLPLPAINPLTLFKRHLPAYMVRVRQAFCSVDMCSAGLPWRVREIPERPVSALTADLRTGRGLDSVRHRRTGCGRPSTVSRDTYDATSARWRWTGNGGQCAGVCSVRTVLRPWWSAVGR
jgi:hypothetical protein